ncbi:MAG: ABC transporter substrate-binding protein [Anaerolineaceae bacterium]
MKRTVRFALNVLLVFSMIFIAVGCAAAPQSAGSEVKTEAAAEPQSGDQPAAATEAAAAAEPKTITVWINGRDSFIGPSEQKLPQDQWYISQAIKRFEAANPGVTVNLVVSPDALQAHQTFRTAGLAGNAPDVANLWAGQFIFALKDVIAPIQDFIPKDDLENISGWDTVTVDFKDGNDVIGYPTPDNQMCFFLYNKKIIQEAGLDFEANPPRTVEAFMDALEKIKQAGYTGMAADEGAGYTYYFFYIAAYWWVQQNGLDPILAADQGKTNFADDQALLNTLDLYHEIYAKGYMNQDAATSADSWNKFLQGTVALYPAVNSNISDAQAGLGAENVGAVLPPDYSDSSKIKDSLIGGPGQSMVVGKNSTNVDLAVKFMSFLNSKDEVLQLYKVQTKVPVRKDLTAADLNLEAGSIGSKIFDWSKNYIFWVDNSLSPTVVDDFNKLLPLVLTGKMTSKDFAAQLDKDKGQ